MSSRCCPYLAPDCLPPAVVQVAALLAQMESAGLGERMAYSAFRMRMSWGRGNRWKVYAKHCEVRCYIELHTLPNAEPALPRPLRPTPHAMQDSTLGALPRRDGWHAHTWRAWRAMQRALQASHSTWRPPASWRMCCTPYSRWGEQWNGALKGW